MPLASRGSYPAVEHVLEAELVGFGLLPPAVTVDRGVHAVLISLREHFAVDSTRRRRGLSRELPEQIDARIGFHAFGDVGLGRVRDLVPEHHRHLRLVLHAREQTGVHVEKAAAEGERVDVRVADHFDAVLERPRIGVRGEALDDPVENGVEARVVDEARLERRTGRRSPARSRFPLPR